MSADDLPYIEGESVGERVNIDRHLGDMILKEVIGYVKPYAKQFERMGIRYGIQMSIDCLQESRVLKDMVSTDVRRGVLAILMELKEQEEMK